REPVDRVAERAFERRRVQLFEFYHLGRREPVQRLPDGVGFLRLRRGSEVLLQNGRVDSAKDFQVLDADKLLAHEVYGDLILGDETVGSYHQRSHEDAAQEQELRAGPQTLEHSASSGVAELTRSLTRASKPKGNAPYRFGNAFILSANGAFDPQGPCCQGVRS